MNTYFTSDSHFGHWNIITYSNRGFKNTDEMDETLIKNWNSVVKPHDLIFHLGDIFICKADRMKEIADQLNGRKILIRGNHDKASNGKFKNTLGFDVYNYYYYSGLLMSHKPLDVSMLRVMRNKLGFLDFMSNLHGHTHDKVDNLDPKLHYNICVENTNYTPVSLGEISKNIIIGNRQYLNNLKER